VKQWRFIVDVALCEDCNNCMLACRDEHVGNDWPGYSRPAVKHGRGWIDIARTERGQFPLVDVAYRPTMCQHCAGAPCVEAGRGAVVQRPDGIVLIDTEKAKGRPDLVASCPYGAIQWNETEGLPQKCTFCAHLLDQGWTETRCVQACPTGALRVVCVGDAEFERLSAADRLEPLAPGLETRPRAAYRNLHRFDRCFVAGSVATVLDGAVEEAVEGAVVTLRRGAAAIDTTLADAFGDFKFDGLEADSGSYTVVVRHPAGTRDTVLDFELGRSRCLGVIYV
jgi:Fe-S-cluster-containing dehydrogenase component